MTKAEAAQYFHPFIDRVAQEVNLDPGCNRIVSDGRVEAIWQVDRSLRGVGKISNRLGLAMGLFGRDVVALASNRIMVTNNGTLKDGGIKIERVSKLIIPDDEVCMLEGPGFSNFINLMQTIREEVPDRQKAAIHMARIYSQSSRRVEEFVRNQPNLFS